MSKDISIAKEVLRSEIKALDALSEHLDDRFTDAVSTCFSARGRVICAGIGKSGHVARKIAATLASTGTPAQFVHPTEASHGDLGMITSEDVVLALSRSGETPELSDLLHYASRFSIPLIGMTARAESALGKAADHLLLIPDVAEACAVTRAPTTSTTLMMALGDALAVALLDRRGFKADDFSTYHPGGKLGAMLRKVSDIMRGGEDIPLVMSGTRFDDAIDVLSQKEVGCVGIVDSDQRLLGILTDGDIRRIVRERKSFETIDQAMTRDPVTVTSDSLAHSAVSLMSARSIMQLFVISDGGFCVGILHMHDVLKAGIV